MTRKQYVVGALSAACLCFATGVNAEGYQVNTLSARQMGMGHTGTGMKLGAESQFFNPAGFTHHTAAA